MTLHRLNTRLLRMRTIFLLNAGTRTRRSFERGLSNTPVTHLKTKNVIAHLKAGEALRFMTDGVAIDFSDSYVFTRLRANDALFCGILYEHLSALGIPASDPITLSYPHAEEKIAQMPRFFRAGLRIPDTIIAREESYTENRDYILHNIEFPCIYKLDGSQGRNVHLVRSLEELDALIEQKPRGLRFLLQAYIPNSFDTRTLVAYGRILGTIKRSAAPGSFLNNVSQGASVEAFSLTAEEAPIALRATALAGLDFGGVDLIHTQDGPIILEVNKSPQITGFERIYGADSVFKTIAEHITTQC